MRQRQELSTETILWLQTTCGNRAVQRLLRRRGLTRTNGHQPEVAQPRFRLLCQSIHRWFRLLVRSEASE